MKINESRLNATGDYLQLAQNATQSGAFGQWWCNDTGSDAYLIELVDSSSNQGYISVKRTPATASVITWSEILRINFDGTIVLNTAFILPPAAPGYTQAKVYLDDLFGRLVAKFRTATETVNLLQSSGFGRVWVEKTGQFPPSGARVWDILIRPAP